MCHHVSVHPLHFQLLIHLLNNLFITICCMISVFQNLYLSLALHSYFFPLYRTTCATASVISYFPVGKTRCTLPSYSPKRCGEMWRLVTENVLPLHCLHSCAWCLLAWTLFIQLYWPLAVCWGDPHPGLLTLCLLITDPLVRP